MKQTVLMLTTTKEKKKKHIKVKSKDKSKTSRFWVTYLSNEEVPMDQGH